MGIIVPDPTWLALYQALNGGKSPGYPTPVPAAGTYTYQQNALPPQPPKEVMGPGGPRLVPRDTTAALQAINAATYPTVTGRDIPSPPTTPFTLNALAAVAGAGRNPGIPKPPAMTYAPPAGGFNFDLGGLLNGIGTKVADLGGTVTNAVAGAGKKVAELTEDPRLKLLAALRPFTGGTLQERNAGLVGPAAMGATTTGLTGAAPGVDATNFISRYGGGANVPDAVWKQFDPSGELRKKYG